MKKTLRRIIHRADMIQRHNPWLAFSYAVLKKTSDDQGSILAALIAYYGLLSLFPLLLVFAAVLGFVLSGDPGLQAKILNTTESSFPALSGYVDKTMSGSELALGIGLGGALWAGLGVSMATERAMNVIWNIPFFERPNPWRSRLRALAMLCILGMTFLASTALASLPSLRGVAAVVVDLVVTLGPLGLNFALYLVAYQVLTNRHLHWEVLAPGAIAGAVGWTALQRLGVYYARHEVAHASHLYGSLAAAIGLLAWIYLGATLTIFCAEINVVLAEHLWPRGFPNTPTEADRRALKLQAMAVRRRPGEVVTVSFSDELPPPP